MNAYEHVLDALEARGLRRGRAFRCPAHVDRGPSLSVRETDQTVLLYCHAGCSLREVLTALDLTLDDLYDDGAWWRTPGEGTTDEFGYVPPPPPAGYIVLAGERIWTDWRDVEWEPAPVLEISPLLRSIEELYPELKWLTQHPIEVRGWLCAEPHLSWLRRKYPEVPSWVWMNLNRSL